MRESTIEIKLFHFLLSSFTTYLQSVETAVLLFDEMISQFFKDAEYSFQIMIQLLLGSEKIRNLSSKEQCR